MEQEDLKFIKQFFFDEELIKTHEGPSGVEIGIVEDKLCLKLVAFFSPIVDPHQAHPAYDGNSIAMSCVVISKQYSKEFAKLIAFLHGEDSLADEISQISFGKWKNIFEGKNRREAMTAIKEIIIENTYIMVSENHPGEITVCASCDTEKFSQDEYNMLVSTYEKCLRELAKYVLAFPASKWVDVASNSIDKMFMGDFGKGLPSEIQDTVGSLTDVFARDTMYQLIAVADAINIAVNTFDSWKKFVDTFPGHWISKAHHNYVKVVGEFNQVDPSDVVGAFSHGDPAEKVGEYFTDAFSGKH